MAVLVLILTGLPTTAALQWTTVEAVLRPQANGAMPAASYEFRNDTAASVTIARERGCSKAAIGVAMTQGHLTVRSLANEPLHRPAGQGGQHGSGWAR